MNLSRKAGRAVMRTVVNTAIKYVDKDREKNLIKVVDFVEKYLEGSLFSENTYEAVRTEINNKDSKWMKYVDSLLEEVDPRVIKLAALNLGYEASLHWMKVNNELREQYKCNIPWVILMDPTSSCNLHCTGCWAAEYGKRLNLSFEEMDDIVIQGKQLGVYFYMFTGGEPLIRKNDIIKLCKKHRDCEFHAFTNGTLIDEELCTEMKKAGNLLLSLSLEGLEEMNDLRRGKGTYQKIMEGMDLLKEYGLLFGASICYTGTNYLEVTSDEFLNQIIEKGCRYIWYFHYMPVSNSADIKLLPTKEQREYLYHRIREIRSVTGGKPIFAIDFQNDGEFVGGCIAGGRNYFHVNANGDVEPCVFIHYSSANIRENTLLEALHQPLFMAYYEKQPFNKNHLKPCPMLENPEFIKEMVLTTGAASTDLQSPESVEGLYEKCKPYAEQWSEKADELWKLSE